jgi:RNA polymerase-binding transcription factor DksA
MARISRSAKARAMRVARQQRQGDYRPLACEACGTDLIASELSVIGSALLCAECDTSSEDELRGWNERGAWEDLDD